MPRPPKPARIPGNRCAMYLRRSHDDREGSIPVQRAACIAYAEARGYVIVAEETDMESAYLEASAGRAGYLRIIDLARAGSIDQVIVWQLTRFGRDAAEALGRMKELKRLGVQLHSTSEDLTNQLLAGILAVMAEDESRRISDRVRPRKRMLAAQGRHQGRIPYGTIRVNGALQPGPRFEVVRTVFDLAADGMGVRDITREVARRFLFDRPPWPTLISDILRNPAYIGTLRGQLPDGYGEVPDCWPAMIDRETFARAQDAITRRRRVQRQWGLQDGWWLRGLVRCQACGGNCSINQSSMVLVSGERRVYHSFSCNHQCRGVHARAAALQEWVFARVRRAAYPASAADRIRAAVAELETATADSPASGRAALVRERAEATLRRDRIEQLLIDGTLAPDRAVLRLREAEAELRALDIRLATLPPPTVIDAELVVRLLTTPEWHEGRADQPARYQRQLGLLLDHVTIGREGARAVQLTPLGELLLAGLP